MLLSMTACPFCLGGNNTACFATYDDGYKCFTCNRSKSYDASYTAFIPRSTRNNKEWSIPAHTSNTSEFSLESLQFLYKYYVFNDIIKQRRISFIPSTNSLLFPVFDATNNNMILCQIRGMLQKTFLTKGEKENLFIQRIDSRLDSRLVIVEDYISAVRVAQFCDVLLLAGTSLGYKTAVQCACKYTDVIVWLDGDDAGIAGAEKVSKVLVDAYNRRNLYSAYASNSPITIDIRSTDLDPKCYTNEEIKHILGGF